MINGGKELLTKDMFNIWPRVWGGGREGKGCHGETLCIRYGLFMCICLALGLLSNTRIYLC